MGTRYSEEEDALLKLHYHRASKAKLLKMFPGRKFQGISARAMKLKCPRRAAIRNDAMESEDLFMLSLKKRRMGLNIRRRDLAKRLGYHETTIARWESGMNVPTYRALTDWCQALGVKLAFRIHGKPLLEASTSRWDRPPEIKFEDFDRSDVARKKAA